MRGWIKDAASAGLERCDGTRQSRVAGLWWLVNTVVGLLDGLLTLLGIMPWKKIRVQGVVLLDEKREPVADRDDGQEVLDLAKESWLRTKANVRPPRPRFEAGSPDS
jgi:hypothetical protein